MLRRNMTPDQLVTALLAPPEIPYVEIALRTGLRLEQITAKLQTLDRARDGPARVLRARQGAAGRPDRRLPVAQAGPRATPRGQPSLEGFLWPATYRVLPDTTPEELVRLMLDGFIANVGEDELTVPEERGLTFYQVLTLASIVEREAVLDEERPLIAGVYQNRIDGIPGIKNKILNADPTVIYAFDTVKLSKHRLRRRGRATPSGRCPRASR